MQHFSGIVRAFFAAFLLQMAFGTAAVQRELHDSEAVSMCPDTFTFHWVAFRPAACAITKLLLQAWIDQCEYTLIAGYTEGGKEYGSVHPNHIFVSATLSGR